MATTRSFSPQEKRHPRPLAAPKNEEIEVWGKALRRALRFLEEYRRLVDETARRVRPEGRLRYRARLDEAAESLESGAGGFFGAEGEPSGAPAAARAKAWHGLAAAYDSFDRLGRIAEALRGAAGDLLDPALSLGVGEHMSGTFQDEMARLRGGFRRNLAEASQAAGRAVRLFLEENAPPAGRHSLEEAVAAFRDGTQLRGERASSAAPGRGLVASLAHAELLGAYAEQDGGEAVVKYLEEAQDRLLGAPPPAPRGESEERRAWSERRQMHPLQAIGMFYGAATVPGPGRSPAEVSRAGGLAVDLDLAGRHGGGGKVRVRYDLGALTDPPGGTPHTLRSGLSPGLVRRFDTMREAPADRGPARGEQALPPSPPPPAAPLWRRDPDGFRPVRMDGPSGPPLLAGALWGPRPRVGTSARVFSEGLAPEALGSGVLFDAEAFRDALSECSPEFLSPEEAQEAAKQGEEALEAWAAGGVGRLAGAGPARADGPQEEGRAGGAARGAAGQTEDAYRREAALTAHLRARWVADQVRRGSAPPEGPSVVASSKLHSYEFMRAERERARRARAAAG